MPAYPLLSAVGTGRVVDPTYLDRPAVLICFGQATRSSAEAVEQAVRQRFPAAEVLVGHVVDLRSVPRMLRGFAESVLRAEFEKAVRELPPGETPEEGVVILPDWEGAFAAALAFEDVNQRPGVAVFAAGQLVGSAHADDIVAPCLALLEQALSRPD
ncbi:MAG TPA: hypothetical protein VNN21_11385 [Dehalococcoidia bacterium]|nr:hypothetical protein [Dehalococcoidia bacterium]